MSEDNEVTVEKAYEVAQNFYDSGNVTAACTTYKDILRAIPNDFASLHCLGIISFKQKKLDEGIEYLSRALEVKQDNHETYNAYGIMLAQLGRHEEAQDAWEKSVALKPDYYQALSNMGNNLRDLDRLEEAKEVCQKAVDANPEYADSYINLGVVLSDLEQHEEAVVAWKKATEINPKHVTALSNIGHSLRALGKIQESEQYSRQALDLNPDLPETLLNLGNALRDQRKFKEAEECYRKASSIRPDYIDAHNNLSILLMDMMRYDEAITSARYAIAFSPNHEVAHNNLAMALRDTGKMEEALEVARTALKLNPDSVEARIALSDILFLSDQLQEAETLCNEALELAPDSARLYMKLSHVLERTSQYDRALEVMNKAIELAPEMPEGYHRQARILFMMNKIDDALASIDKTFELDPNYSAAFSTRSDILQSHGDMEGALEATRAGLAIDDKLPFLHFALSKLKKYTKDDPDFIKLKEVEATSGRYGKQQEIGMNFALFKAHEDVGEYETAFEYLHKGNTIKRSMSVFEIEQQRKTIDIYKKFYTKESIDALKEHGCKSDVPIFIVGMPRSGTTLTEQIISSHPDIFGAGELQYLSEIDINLRTINKKNCEETGQKYIDLVRAISDESAVARKITDKMPGNYMRVGQIAATLPNAKIIHCRRNPVDTCLSCFKQIFARGHYWSYDLDEMAEHYGLYNEMMDYWREIMPERFLEINYEDTVGDFENQARKLLDFVEMPWDDACLTPHKTKRSIMTASKGQVRKPIYKTSVEAWKRYEEQLTPFAEKLKPYMQK